MQKTRWQMIEQIFFEAALLPSDERESFVKEKCGDDELCREIITLLSKDEENIDFLNEPVFTDGLLLLENDFSELLEIGEFSHYKLHKLLGRGGMGAVFLAHDTSLGRDTALKILPTQFADNPESIRRFKQEARAASAISHPNVAHIYEFGEENERYYLAMEYVKGKTLREVLKEKTIDLSRALNITLQIADALDVMHRRGIVHRDIKPENIILAENDLVKILDFGLAKLNAPSEETSLVSLETMPGMIIGTTAYMSPEQVRGQTLDGRSDLWSLGVLLFEMLAAERPFTGETSSDVQAAILLNEPPLLTLPTNTALIVGKLLKKDLSERYESAVELVNHLNELKRNPKPVGQLFSGEPFDENSAFEDDDDSGFFTGMGGFWNKRSLSLRIVMFSGLIGLLTFGFAISANYLTRSYKNKSAVSESFSADSRGKLQISTLFSTRRKPNGSVTDVVFSPDGKFIAFTLSGNDFSDIYVKQVENGEPFKITDGKGKNQSPLWSNDGQQIAFVSDRDNKDGIWTVPYSGGTPVFQTSLENIGLTCFLRKWSNDGARIYYESCKKLFTIELSSGQVSEIRLPKIETAEGFNISSDEKMLTFAAIENKNQQIFTQSLESGELKAVSKNEYHNWSPVFFPDKKRIAYSSNQNGISQIYVSGQNDSEPSQITFGDINASNPVVSPDGTKIIYISETEEANIFALDLKTGKESRETSNTKMQLFPGISPDNKKIVFQTTDNASKILSSPLKVKRTGTEAEPSQLDIIGGAVSWSPRNDAFAFVKQSGIDVNIWKSGVDDPTEKQITFGGISFEGFSVAPYNLKSVYFDWSPDGGKIVYSSKQSGFNNIWTIDEDGGNPQMLTGNADINLKFSSPLWSPDGDQIAFIYRNQIEVKKIRYGISVLSNGEEKNLFESDSLIRLLGWMPNKNEVLAAVGDENDLSLIKISTISGAKSLITANLKGVYINGMVVSPDGQKIAYSARRGGVSNVFVLSINGKELQLTLNLEDTLYYSGLIWSSDGNSLYYSKQSGGIQISMISDSE